MTTSLKIKINSSFQHAEVAVILHDHPGLDTVCNLKASFVSVPEDASYAFAQAIEQRWVEVRAAGGQTNAICSVRRQLANAREVKEANDV